MPPCNVGPIIRGLYAPCGHYHGKPAFKKTQRTNGHDVFLYWWDARDGPDLSGWWFGVEKGSDVVWAYASTDSRYPAHTAWRVPHNGPVDETITLSWTSATIPEEDEEVRWSGNDETMLLDKSHNPKMQRLCRPQFTDSS